MQSGSTCQLEVEKLESKHVGQTRLNSLLDGRMTPYPKSPGRLLVVRLVVVRRCCPPQEAHRSDATERILVRLVENDASLVSAVQTHLGTKGETGLGGAQARQAGHESILFADELQAHVIGLVVHAAVFAHAAEDGSLALAVVVYGQPIAERRLAHVKTLGVPYVRLEPHFRLTSGGHRCALASRVLAEQVGRSASMLATRSLVDLGRRLDERRLADAMRQTLSQVAHRATSHVTRQQLKERLVLNRFSEEGVVA